MLRKKPLEQNVSVPPPFLLGAGGFPPHVKDSMMGGKQKYKPQPGLSGTRTRVLAGPGISLISIGVCFFEAQFPSLLCGHNTSV